MKLNAYLVRSTLVGALGGLLFGFDTAVIAGTTHQLTQVYNLTSSQLGFTVASALIGTVIGAMLAGVPGQRIGRRDSLRIMALLYVVSAVGCGLAWNWDALLAFRIIGGLGIGGSSVLGPMYIAEIAPAQWRGRLVGTFQINIVVGILLAYMSNFVIATLHLGATEWRWKLGVAAIPASLFLIMLLTIGRSPRWLATQDRVDEARDALRLTGTPNTEAELKDIIASIHLDRQTRNEPLLSKKYRLPIFLAVTVGIFNQLSGINAILYYLNDIFAKAGFNSTSSDVQAVYVGLANLIATLVAMSVIDKLGRKTLLLIGAVGMTICLTIVAVIFQTGGHQSYLLPLLIVYIVSFAISQGAVVWVYLGEVFPTNVRAKGQSLGSSANWVTNAIISGVFPVLAMHYAALPFYFFAVMMALQFFIVLFIYPETKGLTLEQMQRKMGLG
ncbi:MAG TPA: sugar porter family MFS transporter [Acidobacteriaceae bacterium]|jgi:sugar porter (SP) family MFS transporter|nr:sugar porter family MFS transporter [Acidobacteriaceae bacterium]